MPLCLFWLNHIIVDARAHVSAIVSDPGTIERCSDWFAYLFPSAIVTLPGFGHYAIDVMGLGWAALLQHTSLIVYAMMLIASQWIPTLIYATWFLYSVARIWAYVVIFEVLGSEFSSMYSGVMQTVLYVTASGLFFAHNPLMDALGQNYAVILWVQLLALLPMYAFGMFWYKNRRISQVQSTSFDDDLDDISVIATA